MRLVVRKLEIPDLGQLQSLVIEHLDGIEPGLTVLDSRLLLGHATVDIVALDADGALVLVTAGFAADEEMLLKAVEAYSWCLEYPDAIRRLYPSVEVSAARPPRLMFVVERMPDAFHRKIKQLGFSEVDCVEFRHLDVSGTPAAYFDTIARLRRGTTLAEFQPAPIARLVSEPLMRRAPEPMIAERPVDKPDHNDKVVPLVTGPSSTRGTSVRLQKMLNSNGQGHGVAPVIDLAARSAASAPRVAPAAPVLEIAAPAVEAVAIETLSLEIDAPAAEIEMPEIELPQMPQIDADTMVVEDELAEAVIEAGRLEAAAAEELRLEIAEPIADVPTMEIAEPIADAPIVEAAAPITEPIAEAAAPELLNPTPEPEAPVAIAEPVARVTLREAIAAPAPVVAPTPVPQAAEPRVSFAEIAKELLGGTKSPAAAPIEKKTAPVGVSRTEKRAPVVEKPAVAEKPAPVAAKPVAVAEKPAPVAAKPVAVAEKPAPVVEKPAPVVAAPAKPVFSAPKPATPAAKPATTSIKPAAPISNPVAPAAKPIAPVAKPAVAAPKAPSAAKPATAAPSATAPTPEAAPAAVEPPAQSLPQEFEGLKFPNDGVLTRQWMEFLNQMASSK